MRYVFEEWTLDTEQYVLYKTDLVIPLQPKVFQVLQYLLTHRDRVIAKQELCDQVWPDQFISDATIESTIKAIRRAVGDDGRTQWCIQTRRGQGYRFVATLKESAEASPNAEMAAQASQSSLEVPSPQAPSLPSGDTPAVSRRQLTVMFCDLVDSTTLSGQVDPEDLRDLMQAYHQACAEVAHRYDGYITQYLGDGLLIYFGYPQAHEDDAQRAIHTGLGILTALDPLSAQLEATHGVRLTIRIGIYTGLVGVEGAHEDGPQDQSAFGEAPDIAAQLQRLARPNELVLSEETRHLAEEEFAYADLGVKTLKGVNAPLRMYRVKGERQHPSRFDGEEGSASCPQIILGRRNSGMERKLAAIFSADVQEYSRLMGDDEAATIRTLTTYREVLSDLIAQHKGRVVDSPGDNLLAEFASVVQAVQCAVAVQHDLARRNADLPAHRVMAFRIGINLGDVIVEDDRLYGDGVNIAARLEGLAEGGGICISGTAYDQVETKLDLAYDDLGEQPVKNIAKPVRAYRVQMDTEVAGSIPDDPCETAKRWHWPVAVGAAVVIVGVMSILLWPVTRRSPTPTPAGTPTAAMTAAQSDTPSIAVLPFANISGDAEQAYFADGMTDDLITDLSKLSSLFVIARHSVFTYKGRTVTIRRWRRNSACAT